MGPQPTTLCDMISVVLTLCGHNRPVPSPSPGEASVLGSPTPSRSSQRRGLSLRACSVPQKKVNPKPGLGKRQHLSSHPLGRELSPLPQVKPGRPSRTPGPPGAAQGPHALLDSSALRPEPVLPGPRTSDTWMLPAACQPWAGSSPAARRACCTLAPQPADVPLGCPPRRPLSARGGGRLGWSSPNTGQWAPRVKGVSVSLGPSIFGAFQVSLQHPPLKPVRVGERSRFFHDFCFVLCWASSAESRHCRSVTPYVLRLRRRPVSLVLLLVDTGHPDGAGGRVPEGPGWRHWISRQATGERGRGWGPRTHAEPAEPGASGWRLWFPTGLGQREEAARPPLGAPDALATP